MRLAFMGSPDAVLAPLQTLIAEAAQHGHELVAVVSQPARPVGRSGVLTDPPVAAFAKQQGILTLQPEKARDPEFLAQFAALNVDVAITAAYGQILPDSFLQLPKRAVINIHPSLLPKYRGATPVPAALLAGESESGVSILFTVQKLDAGAIIAQERSPIEAGETAGLLTLRYFALGAKMLLPALQKLMDASFQGEPQDEKRVSFCKKIDKTDGLIDWQSNSEDIYNRYRAYEPWPGSYTFLQGKRVSVVDMQLEAKTISADAPGTASFDKKHHSLRVATGEGTIHLTKLKPAGGKVMNAAAFWNGLKERSQVVFTQQEAGV